MPIDVKIAVEREEIAANVRRNTEKEDNRTMTPTELFLICALLSICLKLSGCVSPQPSKPVENGAMARAQTENVGEMDVRTAVDLAMTYIRSHDEDWDRFDVQVKRMPDGWKLTRAETREFAIRDPLPACWLVSLSGPGPNDVQMIVVKDDGEVKPLRDWVRAKK